MRRVAVLALALALPGAAFAGPPAPFGVWSTAEGCAGLAATGEVPPEGGDGVWFDRETVYWGVEDNCLVAGASRVGDTGDGVTVLFLNLYCQAPGEHWPEVASAVIDPGLGRATLKIGTDPAAGGWYELEKCRDGSLADIWAE